MVKLTFLGTGGGRVVVINQIRATGGWILEMDNQMFHIDPGPGALVRAKEYGIKLRNLTGVLVSHPHPDHYSDAELVVEAMTLGMTKKKGAVIGSRTVMKGGQNSFHPVFSPYHLRGIEKHVALEPGKSTKIGKVKITATPTKHDGEEGVGFVFEGEKKVGYTADGEYFRGQERYFQNCDVLVLNCLRPKDTKWPTHMNAEEAVELLSKTKPGLAIIKHFGIVMLRAVPEKQAAWIQKESGVKTLAARDGMMIELLEGEIKEGPSKPKKSENLEGFIKQFNLTSKP